jgi:hypothetical protein
LTMLGENADSRSSLLVRHANPYLSSFNATG